jgi:Xaa-Pro aminopeptidase
MRGPTRPQHDVRLEHVVTASRAAGVSGLLVTHPPNIRYLTGLHATSGAVVVKDGVCTLFVDFRYLTAATHLIEAGIAPTGLEVCRVEQTYDETIAEAVRRAGLDRLGVEAEHLPLARWSWLTRRLAGDTPELVATSGLVEDGRLLKDAAEQDLLREAGRRLAGVVSGAFALVGEGRREDEIAGDIDTLIRRVGFEKPAFDTIVASGPNSALPHARPGDRRLVAGDLVLLDFGGVYNGYCVDLTRMATIGMAAPRARELYEAVGAAQRAAIAVVAAGVPASLVDAAARDVLATHGLGEVFGHATGHGLGLEVHEAPRVGRRRDGDPSGDIALQAGMVLTVEPGAYVPGFGGVRIEDDVLVTETGCEVLTDAAHRGLAIR